MLLCVKFSHLIIFLGTSELIFGFPVKNEKPLEARVLENPKLFGGDMLGLNLTKGQNRNAVPYDFKLWPMGIIPYEIDPSLSFQRELILNAMNQYHEHTCIRFQERNNEYDYVYIFKGEGCYSFVGRYGGKQVLSLANGCEPMGTIVHELGHAVGFFHEHQRSDRDEYIDIIWNNVAPEYKSQFEILRFDQNKLLYPFDYNSIMLYGPLTYSIDRQMKTMIPKTDGVSMKEVYQKYGLSDVDIKSIQKLYDC